MALLNDQPNPNARFRTYSYHHILIVCSNVQVAESLEQTGTLNDLSNLPPSFTSISPLSDIGSSNGGQYAVLVNGMKDSHFVVRSAWWESLYEGDDMSSEPIPVNYRGSVQEIGGEIIIEEPAGVEFFNTLAILTKEFGLNPSQQVFLLKTIFVGYTAEGTQEIDTNLSPCYFNPYDIEFEITSVGSLYRLLVVSVVNGGGYINNNYDKMGEGFSFTSPKNATLGEALKKLEKDINEHSQELLEKVYEEEKQAIEDEIGKAALPDNNKKLVKIVINVNDNLKNLRIGGNTKSMVQDTGENDVNITGSRGIREIIEKLIASSEEVVRSQDNEALAKKANDEQLRKSRGQGPAGTGAIVDSSGRSNPVEQKKTNVESNRRVFPLIHVIPFNTEDTMTVNYQVNGYVTGIEPAEEKGQSFAPPESDILIFEYLFTGRNTDIRDLNLKGTLGKAFYHSVASASSNTEQESMVNNKIDKGAFGKNDPNIGHPERKKLNNNAVLPPRPKGASSFNKLLGSSGDYFEMLNKFLQLNQIKIEMSIIGDPRLLSDTTISPTRFLEMTMDTSGESYGQTSSNISQTPIYFKVNIRYPSRTADYGEFKLIFNGVYRIMSIKHIFDNGEFTQDITGVTLPSESPNATSSSSSDARYGAVSSTGGSSFSGKIYSNRKSVDGKTDFSPEVNDAIHKAAVKHGIDEDIMRNMCWIETGGTGDPRSISPTKAKGLFQFTNATGRRFGLMNDDDKFDPYKNADAAARYMKFNAGILEKKGLPVTGENLYILHQQGEGGGPILLKGAQQGLQWNQLSSTLRSNMGHNNSYGKSAEQYVNKWNNIYAQADRATTNASNAALPGGQISAPNNTAVAQNTNAQDMTVEEKLNRVNNNKNKPQDTTLVKK